MACLSPTVDRPVATSQVWERLAAEDQCRVIRLMAQLAYQVVAERVQTPPREVGHVRSPSRVQDPS